MFQLDYDGLQQLVAADFSALLGSEELDATLVCKAATMIFSQGSTHSSRRENNNIFSQYYLRDGNMELERSLYYSVIKTLKKFTQQEHEFIIPICDESLAEHVGESISLLLDNKANILKKTLYFADKEVLCLHVIYNNNEIASKKDLERIVRECGRWGALATKDILFWILAANIDSNPNHVMYTGNKKYTATNISEMLSDIIDKLLKNTKIKKFLDSEEKTLIFYRGYLTSLIAGLQQIIANTALSKIETTLIHDALIRFILKLELANEADNYSRHLIIFELAFDEIINVLHIVKYYNKPAIFKAISDHLCKSVALPRNQRPEQTMLGASCMQVVNNNIATAVKYFSDAQQDEVQIFMSEESYHEIKESFGSKRNLIINTANTPVRLAHIMVLAFNANVDQSRNGFGCYDVIAQINQQLTLRKKSHSTTQLIAIIDVTMNGLEDVQIKQLLATFNAEINSGRLAIVFAYSLTKYFSLGLDRTPAGIGAIFFKKNLFKGFKPKNELIGFDEFDASPQIIAHMLHHAQSHISWYYNRIHSLSKLIHDTVIPQELYNRQNAIYIDSPYTADAHKKPWGFILIRFANMEIGANYLPTIKAHMKSINVDYRDGFAFNQSTYATFSWSNPPLVRISLGPEASKAQFASLMDLLVGINQKVQLEQATLRQPSRSRYLSQ